MTNSEVHQELSALGVSAEVHALVDDLDLDFGPPPFFLRCLLKRLKLPYVSPKCFGVYVFKSYYNKKKKSCNRSNKDLSGILW